MTLSMYKFHQWAIFSYLIFIFPFNQILGYTLIKNLTTGDGLSQNTVQCIYQDHSGYLWFGTQGGLSRFDGYNFKVFRHDPANPNSLSNNSITSIYEDSEHNLWIGTIKGLNKFERSRQSFTHYSFVDVSKISELPARFFPIFNKKYLLLASGIGLYLFHKQEERSSRLILPELKTDHQYLSILDYVWQPGSEPILWLASRGNGLIRATFSGFKIINSERFRISPGGNATIRCLAVQNDTLWVGTSQGLYFSSLKVKAPKFHQWQPGGKQHFGQIFVRKIWFDKEGRLLIGTMRHGLMVLDKGKIETINSGAIYSIFIDAFKSLWVGTSGDGIFQYCSNKNIFKNYQPYSSLKYASHLNHIWSIYQGPKGSIWLGTNHGLTFFNPDSPSLPCPKNLKSLAQKIGDVQVRVIKKDAYDNIWIGTLEKGLFQLQKDGTIHQFSTHSPAGLKLPFNQVYSLCEDDQHNLWIGLNSGGLSQAIIRDGQIKEIINHRNLKIATKDNRLWLLHILETRRGPERYLWLATWNFGLLRFNPATSRIKMISTSNYPGLLSDYILTLHYSKVAERPVLWLGTYGGGLARLDLKDYTIHSYLEKDGLADNVVYAILEDRYHNLWLSTNHGISVFNPQTEHFINYSVEDGLLSSEFNLNAAYKSSDGKLFFGGVNGVSYIEPRLAINDIPPRTSISSITIYCKNQKRTLWGPFYKPIRLSHDENALVIHFVGLHTKNPRKNKYAYQMSGWGNKWIQAGDQRQVTFLNLKPGRYAFKVKACNCDGIWNVRPASVIISIAPPLWQTNWAIIFYLLCIGFLLYYWHRKKLAQEIKIARIKEQERLKTKNEIDLDLHDDLGLGIYSIIHICHDRLLKEYHNKQAMDTYRKILNLAQSLDSELREYIWEIESTQSTLYDLIVKLRSNADLIFDGDEYDFQLENQITDAHKIEIPLRIRRAIVNIVKEGMTNILKHSESCEQINLKFQHNKEGILQITLSDDGAGFDLSENHSGKGLRSMYRRIEKVGGTLNIISEKGNGTKLILRVKLS